MTLRAEWLVYSPDFSGTEYNFSIGEPADVDRFLSEVRSQRAEEVLVHLASERDGEERHLTFQFNEEKTRAYVYYAQSGAGAFEAIGDPESPEKYTSSGGSFSAGTAVPEADLKRALTEFLRTKEKPSCLMWTEEA